MLLVVYGHSLSTGWGIDRWIYSFHVPLFFIVSGALLTPRRLGSSFREFFGDTVRALVPAYATFAAIGFVAWLVVLRRFGADAEAAASPLRRLAAVFYATGKPEGFRVEPSALWFFPCLFSARLIVYWTHRFARGSAIRLWTSTAILAAVGFLLPARVALPLELDAAVVAQSFVVIGMAIERHEIVQRLGRRAGAVVPVLLAVGAFCAYSNAQVDLRASRYGNVALYYVAAVATSLGVVIFFSRCGPSRIATRIAENTIVVFPLHLLVFSVFAAVYVFLLHVPLTFRENPAVGALATIANLSLLVAAAPLFRRFLPWVYGLRPTGEEAIATRAIAVARAGRLPLVETRR